MDNRSKPPPPPAERAPPAPRERARDAPPPATPPPRQADALPEAATLGQQVKAQATGLATDEATITAGRAGERNIQIEWVPVVVGQHIPVYFVVTTAPGNALDVTLEQAYYSKSFAGVGRVQTDLVPIAPIGTKGRIVARDTTTGEGVLQPWTWRSLGRPSLLGRLWALLKRLLFTPSAS